MVLHGPAQRDVTASAAQQRQAPIGKTLRRGQASACRLHWRVMMPSVCFSIGWGFCVLQGENAQVSIKQTLV
jgi:hypothetical protein